MQYVSNMTKVESQPVETIIADVNAMVFVMLSSFVILAEECSE